MRKIIIIFLFLGLILAQATTAKAFRLIRYNADSTWGQDTQPHWWPVHDTSGQKWHNFCHWDLREFPECRIPWSAHGGTTDLPGDTEFVEVATAFSSWAAVSPSVIGFRKEDVVPSDPPLHRDDYNAVGWGAGLDTNILATTAIWRVMSTGRILESDILFNDPHWHWIIGAHDLLVDSADVQSIAAHEIGHFIGLHHSEINGGAFTCPTMWWNAYVFDWQIHQRSLQEDDKRGCNFLYTPDIGDAPDPAEYCLGVFNLYPSLVHDPGAGRMLNWVQLDEPAAGAEHIFGTKGHGDPDDGYLYEWLGDDVSGECESNQTNADPRDDGVLITVDPINFTLLMEVTVSSDTDAAGNSHNYAAHNLYLNIWVDWNCDCDWDDAGEYVVGPGEIVNPSQVGVPEYFTYVIPIPDCECDSLWIRARLDWGEDCGTVNIIDDVIGTYGAAQFGEVEDYVVICPREPWRWKDSYGDYAPSGMPDFSQLQDNWYHLVTLQSTFCGPVAIANCFWWFDSRYETDTGVPGDGVDMFPLVRDYLDDLDPFMPIQDDHDMWNVDHTSTGWPPVMEPPVTSQPFIPGEQVPGGGLPAWGELVERLAWYLDTDGMRSADPSIIGTKVYSMEAGVSEWLESETFEDGSSLADSLCIVTTPRPTFAYVESLVVKCKDVILLLGFWFEETEGSEIWWRVGGHYVTAAGVNSDEFQIAFSDPFIDWAEFGNPGRVGSGDYIPHEYPHTATTVHNDAGNVSHDIYNVMDPSPSPGGLWSLEDYPVTLEPELWMESFYAQNVPDEFLEQTAPWDYSSIVYTEVEYCVHISPWDYRGDVQPPGGDGVVDLGDVLFIISYLYKGGSAPVPYSEGEVNCDGIIDLGDVLFLISYLYKGGPVSKCCDL